jgi:arginine kinase
MVGSWMKSADEIKNFPYFPSGTKSLLSKCLTREIWE